MSKGWIGVDLDGTLAHYEHGQWKGVLHIGDPVPAMLERVRTWLREGRRVKIMTARVAHGSQVERALAIEAIHKWLQLHDLPALEVTCIKDMNMVVLYDDRAVQVVPNTGMVVG